MTAARTFATAARRQRGVYAVEYALVFLVFFTLLYAIICYGIFFTFRFGLQNAAEDGARAALRYQPNLLDREKKARDIASAQMIGWLPSAIDRDVAVQVCQIETSDCASTSRACGAAWESRCEVIVTITASNIAKVLPPLPSFALPSALNVQASMLLDGRAP